MKQIYRISPLQLPYNIKHHKNCVSCSRLLLTGWSAVFCLLCFTHWLHLCSWIGFSSLSKCFAVSFSLSASVVMVVHSVLYLCKQKVEELVSRALPLGQMWSRSQVLQMVSAIFVHLHVLPRKSALNWFQERHICAVGKAVSDLKLRAGVFFS